MKSKIIYTLDSDDPSLTYIDHAINRLANFKEPADEAFETACNKLLKNKEFEARDLYATGRWLLALSARAKEKYGASNAADPVVESILQAAQHAEDCAEHLAEWFKDCAPV